MKIYIAVEFNNSKKTYYFYTEDESIVAGDKVIVETVVGKELGTVNQTNINLSEKSFALEIKPIIRKATPQDIKINAENISMAKNCDDAFRNATAKLKLDMRLISSEYTFDRTKVLFVYASEERIDFRELLKILASELHCRIELKQINSRERAQSVGGIGICGLPLCCASFFKVFDGISLNRAKNQMLAINIPKLSGQCGKLMCCLKYEDDLYTEKKKEFPKMGSRVQYKSQTYKVTGLNILTNIIRIENDDNIDFVDVKEIKFEKNEQR